MNVSDYLSLVYVADSSFATDGSVMKQKKDLQHKPEMIVHHEDDWRIGDQLGNRSL